MRKECEPERSWRKKAKERETKEGNRCRLAKTTLEGKNLFCLIPVTSTYYTYIREPASAGVMGKIDKTYNRKESGNAQDKMVRSTRAIGNPNNITITTGGQGWAPKADVTARITAKHSAVSRPRELRELTEEVDRFYDTRKANESHIQHPDLQATSELLSRVIRERTADPTSNWAQSMPTRVDILVI